jgi:hypothetical protein
MEPNPVLGVILRWLHIASVVILIGGVFYARYFAKQLVPQFRGWAIGAMVVLIGSGLYTLLTKSSIPDGYHAFFGVKMLLVLHIFVVGLLITTPAVDEPKRLRMMTGIVYSGLAVLLISSWLRWISLP